MERLRTLLDDAREGLPLPAAVADLYGGPLELAEDAVYSNFVSSVDGVVALDVPGLSSGSAISGRNAADRFVMGLLRACASCVLVGASTVRDEPGVLWDPEFVAPSWSEDWIRLRHALGLPPSVLTAIVSASGKLDLGQPVFRRHPLVYTTPAGAQRLGSARANEIEVAVFDDDWLDMRQVLADLRRRGHRRVLTEGGPALMGALLEHRLLDTIFLTLSPLLAGRQGRSRAGMVHGIELLPEQPLWGRLRSLKLWGSHLFLRYDLGEGAG